MNNYQLVDAAMQIYQTKNTKYELGTFLDKTVDGFLLTDCLGLIEGILWGYPYSGRYKSNGIPDLATNTLINVATVKGPISSIPEIPGLLVYKYGNPVGHVGIYLGNGRVLEATSHVFSSGEGDGIVISQYWTKSAKNYRGSWTHWLQYPYIEYLKERKDVEMLSYGLTQTKIGGIRSFIYKLDKRYVGIRQIANEPLDTPITLKAAVGGKKLTSYYSDDRKVPSWIEVFNKVSGKTIMAVPFCYFEDHKTYKNYGEIYGRCQGINISRKPDQEAWLDLIIDLDMHIVSGDGMGQLASWEYLDVTLGTSPALILHRNGESRKLYSEAVGWLKYTSKKTQTFLAEDSESIMLGVVDGLILPQTVCDWLVEEHGCTQVAFGDSGGSAYAYYNEENEPNTGDVEPDVPAGIKEGTRRVVCTKGTLKNGQFYPTRPNINAVYSTTSYLIAVGNELEFDDVKPIQGKLDCYFQISGCWVDGVYTDALNGRWFAYDKDYFD